MYQAAVRFRRAIICEDVREEADGRFSLMGAISGQYNFYSSDPEASAPTADLAFYIECEVLADVDVEFRLLGVDGETTLFSVSGKFQSPDEAGGFRLGAVPIERRNIALPESGRYELQGRVVGGDWSTLNELYVSISRGTRDNHTIAASANG